MNSSRLNNSFRLDAGEFSTFIALLTERVSLFLCDAEIKSKVEALILDEEVLKRTNFSHLVTLTKVEASHHHIDVHLGPREMAMKVRMIRK